jgi:hypothetical protein
MRACEHPETDAAKVPTISRHIVSDVSGITLADLTGFEPATSGLTGRRALRAAPQVLDQVVRGRTVSRDDSDRARTPNGIRTRATALKGRRPRPLDDGGSHRRAREA